MDRYAYVNNNPIRYTDPTGHWCEPGDYRPDGYCYSPTVEEVLSQQYGVDTSGLDKAQQESALAAATSFGKYYFQNFGSQYGFTSPQDAFKKVTGGNITITLDESRNDCQTIGSAITCGPDAMTPKAFVHEYFHVMDNHYKSSTDQTCPGGDPCLASNNLPYEYHTDPHYTSGPYKCNGLKCISHPDTLPGYDFTEAFANAGENLVLGALNIDPSNNGFAANDYGRAVQGWMEVHMPVFLDEILGVK